MIAISAKGVDTSLVLKVVGDSSIPANCVGILLVLITLEHRMRKEEKVGHSCAAAVQIRWSTSVQSISITPRSGLCQCTQQSLKLLGSSILSELKLAETGTAMHVLARLQAGQCMVF